jgi:hypothetical protein
VTRRPRRLLQLSAIALLVALGAGLAAALLRGGGQERIDLGGRPIIVQQQLVPLEPQFGDTVTATAEVFTRAGIDPRAVRVRTHFAPYGVVSTTRRVREVGDVAVVSVITRLRCLEVGCLPKGTLRTFRFKPLRVLYGGGSTTEPWPALRVHSRLTKSDTARPIVRVPPPVAAPVHYRISPTAAGIVLLVLAVLLAAGGAFLLLRVAVRRIGPARPSAPPLEQVLGELAASCSNGNSARRRRALEALARELEPLDEALSDESRVLAWAPSDPQAATISDLTKRVRTAVRR